MYQLCKRKVVCFHKISHSFGGFGENLILIVSLVCFQGQFRDSSGADQVQAGAGRLPGQFEEGADEGGLSRAHAGAKGQSDLLNNRVLGCKGNVKSLKKYIQLFHRTKRSRSWQRSATSWSPRWGRVSSRATPRPNLTGGGVVEKLLEKWSGSVIFTTLPKDWWTLKARMVLRLNFLLTMCIQDPQEWLPLNHSVQFFLMCQCIVLYQGSGLKF